MFSPNTTTNPISQPQTPNFQPPDPRPQPSAPITPPTAPTTVTCCHRPPHLHSFRATWPKSSPALPPSAKSPTALGSSVRVQGSGFEAYSVGLGRVWGLGVCAFRGDYVPERARCRLGCRRRTERGRLRVQHRCRCPSGMREKGRGKGEAGRQGEREGGRTCQRR